jgi:hypothetical protein
VENAEGKRLMESIEENGWEVLNGNKQGEWNGIQCGNHLWNKFSNFKTNDICQKR